MLLKGNKETAAVFSPDGKLAISCQDDGNVSCWEILGPHAARVVGIYLAAYAVKTIHWLDQRHLLLADTGGPRDKPNFYRLMLEGF